MAHSFRVRFLPGAPRRTVGLVVALTCLTVALALGGMLPASGSAGRLLLTLPTYAAALGVLEWRSRRVPTERDVWRRLTAALYAVVALLTVGAVLAAVPATRELAGAVLAWAPLASYPFFYAATVCWNRDQSDLADRNEVVLGATGVLINLAGLNLLVEHVDTFLAVPPGLAGQGQLAQFAAAAVLAQTALARALPWSATRDHRSWLVIGFFGTRLVSVAALLITGQRPAWTAAITSVGIVALVLAAVLRPVRKAVIPGNVTIATLSAVGITVIAITIMCVEGLLGNFGLACLLAGGAAVGASIRTVVNARELGHLVTTRREAMTDELTGLANRRAVLRHLDDLCRRDRPLAFVMLDLDKFKEVNDSLGHAAGDQLLQLVSARIDLQLRGGDLLGRLGGDEFAVVVDIGPGPDAQNIGQALADRLHAAMAEPFVLSGTSVHVGASIGIASTGGSTAVPVDPARVMRQADAAMYDAKRTRTGPAHYDSARHADAAGLLPLLEDLRAGLERGELVLHHQPQVDVRTGTTTGVEALVRWAHPTRGLLGPAEFLPMAEAHGLMGEITDRVMADAVAQLASWRNSGLRLRMSVNLSASNLLEATLPDRVATLLAAHRVPGSLLTLEVTESVLLGDRGRSGGVLAAVRELGVGLSIDDFGTGYCSLAYLRELPATELKLDRSFTADLLADERTAAIVASTIELAHRLGLRVVAEGVEDDDTYARLIELGCDESQGYLHSRPLPAPALEEWLDRPAVLAG